MPKNKGKGGKSRRRGKNDSAPSKRELVLKEEGQAYAQIQTMLGNNRLQAMCDDRVQRMCHIRGKMRKKVWMGVGDIILVGLRDFQDDKADVILKYLPEEARMLKSKGQLPDFFNECNDDEGGAVEFVDDFDDSTSEEDVFFDGSDEEEVEEGAEGAAEDAVEEGDEDIARPTQRKGEKVIPGIGKKTAEKLAEEKKEREMEKLMPKSKLKKERGPSKREIKRSEDRDKKRNYSLDDL